MLKKNDGYKLIGRILIFGCIAFVVSSFIVGVYLMYNKNYQNDTIEKTLELEDEFQTTNMKLALFRIKEGDYFLITDDYKGSAFTVIGNGKKQRLGEPHLYTVPRKSLAKDIATGSITGLWKVHDSDYLEHYKFFISQINSQKKTAN